MKRWIAPLVLALTAFPAGFCGAYGAVGILAAIGWRVSCGQHCDLTPLKASLWNLPFGLVFILLAAAWFLGFARHVLRLRRERERRPPPLVAAVAILCVFVWAVAWSAAHAWWSFFVAF
jgi:hypothetical protein